MSLSRWILILAVLVFVSVACGDYQIVWSTTDGGGGQSTGGQYVLTGTIGQPDAADSEGGIYELLSGFWPGGPLCIVDFHDFALLANQWLQIGPLPADLDGDSSTTSSYLSLNGCATVLTTGR